MEEKTQSDITIRIQKESDLKDYSENFFIDLKNIKNIGNYEIITELETQGGQADIFLVKNKNQQHFVLKLYKKNVDINNLAINKVIELSRIYPQYFLKIYELNYEPELQRYYEVQEYIEYGNLEEFHKKILYKDLNYSLIDKIIYKINEALNILHSNGIIHRDLKPSNILIRNIIKSNNKITDLELVLSDFNISALIDISITKKMTQDIKGTILYLAPESFSNIVKKESDYWALGIILYELLTNCNPFQNINVNLIIYTLLTKGIEIPNNLPLKYQLLLKGLLQTNPDKRFTYNQVKEILNAKTDQELTKIYEKYFKDTQNNTNNLKTIIKYNNKEYYSIENLLVEFIRDYESFLSGLEFFKTKDFENLLSQTDKEIIKKIYSYGVIDDIAFSLFLSYKLNLPFSLYNIQINSQNITSIIDKYLDKIELSPSEHKILNLIKNIFSNNSQNLEKYYNIYANITNKIDPKLETFFNNLSKINFYNQKNISIDNILRFVLILSLTDKKKYILPKGLNNFNIFEYNLSYNIPVISYIIERSEIDYLNRIYILPYEVKNLANASIRDYIQIVSWLKNNKDDLILKKDITISRDISIKEYEVLKKKVLQQKIKTPTSSQRVININPIEFNKLVIINRLLMENNLRDNELNYYLNNPQNLNWQIYDRIYKRNIKKLVDVIYSKNRRFRIPSSLIVLFFLSIFSCLFLGIGFFVCRNPFTFLYMFGWNYEYLYSCLFGGIFLVFLIPLIVSPFIISDLLFYRNISKEKIQIELENRIDMEAKRNLR